MNKFMDDSYNRCSRLSWIKKTAELPTKHQTTEEWLAEGNKIKVIEPYTPKITDYISTRLKSNQVRKRNNK